MPLAATTVHNAKPAEKPYKLYDERGLYLLVQPNGSKLWRLKFHFNGVEKSLALGIYPDVTLALAHKRRDAARQKIAEGIDPNAAKRAARETAHATFEAVALEWFEKFKDQWSEKHQGDVLARMKANLFPTLGKKIIRSITTRDVLDALRKIEARGARETARRVRQICSQVFRYAKITGRADNDPSADLRGALAPPKVTHLAAITDPKKAAELLRILDGYEGSIIVVSALRLAPLVFVRPGELRKAEWSEIDLDAAQWSIPASRMKMRQPLIVPLSTQGVAILRKLYDVTGDGKYVFPSARTNERPMSDNAVLAALRRSGIPNDEMTGHGFRAMARTILDEVLHYRVDIIEQQLGHAVMDPNGRAYNRTSFLAERTKMMQEWADYLDKIKSEKPPEPKPTG